MKIPNEWTTSSASHHVHCAASCASVDGLTAEALQPQSVHALSPTSLIWKQARARSCAFDVLLGMNDITKTQTSRMVEMMDFNSC